MRKPTKKEVAKVFGGLLVAGVVVLFCLGVVVYILQPDLSKVENLLDQMQEPLQTLTNSSSNPEERNLARSEILQSADQHIQGNETNYKTEDLNVLQKLYDNLIKINSSLNSDFEGFTSNGFIQGNEQYVDLVKVFGTQVNSPNPFPELSAIELDPATLAMTEINGDTLADIYTLMGYSVVEGVLDGVDVDALTPQEMELRNAYDNCVGNSECNSLLVDLNGVTDDPVNFGFYDEDDDNLGTYVPRDEIPHRYFDNYDFRYLYDKIRIAEDPSGAGFASTRLNTCRNQNSQGYECNSPDTSGLPTHICGVRGTSEWTDPTAAHQGICYGGPSQSEDVHTGCIDVLNSCTNDTECSNDCEAVPGCTYIPWGEGDPPELYCETRGIGQSTEGGQTRSNCTTAGESENSALGPFCEVQVVSLDDSVCRDTGGSYLPPSLCHNTMVSGELGVSCVSNFLPQEVGSVECNDSDSSIEGTISLSSGSDLELISLDSTRFDSNSGEVTSQCCTDMCAENRWDYIYGFASEPVCVDSYAERFDANHNFVIAAFEFQIQASLIDLISRNLIELASINRVLTEDYDRRYIFTEIYNDPALLVSADQPLLDFQRVPQETTEDDTSDYSSSNVRITELQMILGILRGQSWEIVLDTTDCTEEATGLLTDDLDGLNECLRSKFTTNGVHDQMDSVPIQSGNLFAGFNEWDKNCAARFSNNLDIQDILAGDGNLEASTPRYKQLYRLSKFYLDGDGNPVRHDIRPQIQNDMCNTSICSTPVVCNLSSDNRQRGTADKINRIIQRMKNYALDSAPESDYQIIENEEMQDIYQTMLTT